MPPGMAVHKGATLRARVLDSGTNDRAGLLEVISLASPQLPPGGQAYRFIPDWRERGLSRNFERVELPPEHRGNYLVVQGSYMVRCSP